MVNYPVNLKITLSQKDRSRGMKLPKILESNLAYLCGILTGDGSIYQRKQKKDYIIKCVGNPKNEIPFYNQILLPCFKTISFTNPKHLSKIKEYWKEK